MNAIVNLKALLEEIEMDAKCARSKCEPNASRILGCVSRAENLVRVIGDRIDELTSDRSDLERLLSESRETIGAMSQSIGDLTKQLGLARDGYDADRRNHEKFEKYHEGAIAGLEDALEMAQTDCNALRSDNARLRGAATVIRASIESAMKTFKSLDHVFDDEVEP